MAAQWVGNSLTNMNQAQAPEAPKTYNFTTQPHPSITTWISSFFTPQSAQLASPDIPDPLKQGFNFHRGVNTQVGGFGNPMRAQAFGFSPQELIQSNQAISEDSTINSHVNLPGQVPSLVSNKNTALIASPIPFQQPQQTHNVANAFKSLDHGVLAQVDAVSSSLGFGSLDNVKFDPITKIVIDNIPNLIHMHGNASPVPGPASFETGSVLSKNPAMHNVFDDSWTPQMQQAHTQLAKFQPPQLEGVPFVNA